MSILNNLVLSKLNPSTGEDLKPTVQTLWQDGITPMSDSLCGGLYNKDTEPTSDTNGQYFRWNFAGAYPISRLTTVNQSNFQKLINDFGSKPATIVLDKSIDITSDLTIPINIGIDQMEGALFNISDNVTLNIKSSFKKGNTRLFSGNGNVILNSNDTNVYWFGAVADFNTTTLTGTDNTVAFERATTSAISSNSRRLVIPPGRYGLVKYTLKGISITCTGIARLHALTSSEPSFFKLDEGVVQAVTWERFQLIGNINNTTQIGLDITAIRSEALNTGGLWYSKFKDIEISGFKGHAAYFEALDPLVSGIRRDIANQFLYFENVKFFRGSAAGRALKVVGQFGQVRFKLCQFDGAAGAENMIVDTVNVELISPGTAGNSDEIYSVDFDTCTFQAGDKGIRIYYGRLVNFNGCHWENMARPLYLEAGSVTNVKDGYFGNCGLASLVTGSAITGCLMYVGPTTITTFEGNFRNGGNDVSIILDNPSGLDYGKGNKFTPTFSGTNYQASINVSGVLETFSINAKILINAGSNTLTTINSTKGLNDEIILDPLGTLTISTGGNILIQHGVTTIVFRPRQLVKLVKTLSSWVVMNPDQSYSYSGSGTPEGTVVAKKGTIYHRQDAGVSSLYVKGIEDGGANNTGWEAIELVSSNTTKLSTKVNKSTSANQTSVSANTLTTGDFSDILLNANNTTLQTITSNLGSGDMLRIKVWAGTDIKNPYIVINALGNITLGGFGINGKLIVRDRDMITLVRYSVAGAWNVVAVHQETYLNSKPTAGYHFLGEKLNKFRTTINDIQGWLVTTEGYAGGVYGPAGSYLIGNSVTINGNTYTAATNGTAANNPPSGTGTGQVDGTVTWDYTGVAADFSEIRMFSVPEVSSSTSAPNKAALNAAYGTKLKGFYVDYPSIVGGGFRYTKMADGNTADWHSTSITLIS